MAIGEPNIAPITIALRGRAAETGSGTSLAILLRNAAEIIEQLRDDRRRMAETFEDVTDRLRAADAMYGRCVAIAEGRVRGDLGPYLQPVIDGYALSSHEGTHDG